MEMRKMKQRIGILLLAAVLFTSIFPSSIYASAEENQSNGERQAAATEIPTDDSFISASANEQLKVSSHKDNELVTVIVEMEEEAVLAHFDGEATEGQESAGDAVAEYLASSEAKELEQDLLEGQEEVIDQVEDITEEAEVLAQWTSVMNGFAVEVPYGELEEINELDSVSHAYVQHVYDRPEITTESVDLTKDKYTYSLGMVGVEEAWEAGYTGKGMLVAILDTGIDIIQNKANGTYVASHEVFSNNSFKGNPSDAENGWELRYTEASMTSFLADTALWANTSAVDNTTHITYDNNALYKNRKVPFGYDYADLDVHTRPADSDHGTHVAGTIAGYHADEAGNTLFSGVAPDAQILAMKVFPDADGGAEELSIVCALEDSVKLGADIINLSLGSDNGYADDDTYQNRVFKNVSDAGIVMMTSAGNSSDSTDDNNYGGYNKASDPETSMISSPAVYEGNLAVASIDNMIDVNNYLVAKAGDETSDIYYSDTQGTFATKLNGVEYPIIPVGGTGSYNDYYSAGFDNGYNGGKTGIALVKRGTLSFVDKITNASYFHGTNSRGQEYGVVGVIIYNNEDSDDLISMSVTGTTIPSCFISGNSGNALLETINGGTAVTISPALDQKTIDNKTAGQMSVFSSWGAGSALELKPEITAPGGNVWSSVINKKSSSDTSYQGAYEMMSGTSMAAPHMSGIGALVRQRVNSEAAASSLSTEEKGLLTQEILVSTAVPQKDTNGEYYSPRFQGAGLVNAAAAIKTPAYITVEGKKVGKLELGDDPEKTGSYDLAFTVNNLSDSSLTYDMKVVLMTPEAMTKDGEYFTTKNDKAVAELSLGTVTVAANGSSAVSKTVSLSDAVKSDLDEKFANGIYVEGYVILEDATETNPTLGAPILAFYGDWTKAPIFDSANWLEAQDGESIYNNDCTWNNSILGSKLLDANGNTLGYYNLGQNIFETDETKQTIFSEENVALSPNGDGYLDAIDDIILYQVRNAKAVVFEAKDSKTGEVYYKDVISCCSKTVYESSYGFAVPYTLYYSSLGWDGKKSDGSALPDGTLVDFTVTAYNDGDYSVLNKTYSDYYKMDVTDFMALEPGEKEPTFNGHAMDKTGDVLSCKVLIDTDAPHLENNAVSFYEKDGHTYMKASVYDEVGNIASVEVTPIVKRTAKYDTTRFDYAADRNNAFLSDVIYDTNTHTYTVEVDVTEYAHTVESYSGENYSYDFTWEGNLILSAGDYAGNDRSYAISANADPGIVLSQKSALLNVGEKFTLSVNDNTEDHAPLTRSSSNPEVATVDEYGLVTAKAVGQAIITVSNGTDSAVCVVAVKEIPTEVEDFDLSITEIKDLKTDGQATVFVKNLYPADVELSEIKWEVFEDDDYAENYAEGLVTVIKNTDDGLSGSVCMNVGYSNDLLPGGHATLRVTLNGVSREADIYWDDVYQTSDEDGLVSNELYQEQAVTTTLGTPAEFTAKYRTASQHEVGDVATVLNGLVLDGADFFNRGGSYSAKLVPEKGYALPSSIKVYTVYSYGYEYERYADSDYGYRYNATTGEVTVKYAPTGQTSLKIVADGVVDESNQSEPALSGATYTKPDGLYGPYDWELLSGDGDLEIFTYTDNYGDSYEKARYTPASVGVSYIKAKSKTNDESIVFAVVCDPVVAEKLEVENHKIELMEDYTKQLETTLSPSPSLEKDKELIWTSFDESVATVSDTGLVYAKKEGYAYIRVVSKANTKLSNYFIVHVNPFVETEHKYANPTFKWSKDYKTCTVTYVCEYNSEHTVTYDCDVTSKVTKEASCIEKGQITYTAVYGTDMDTKTATFEGEHKTSLKVTPASTKANGKIETICSVCKKVVESETIKKIKSVSLPKIVYSYTGKAIKPEPVVKDSDGKIISSKYYTVSYKNNKFVGIATATVTFKGNYTGKVTKTFLIIPRCIKLTSVKAKGKTLSVKWAKIGSDASGVQLQFSTDPKFKKNVGLVTVAGKGTSKTITGLKSGKKYYVRIRTYKKVNGKKVYSDWSALTKNAKIK